MTRVITVRDFAGLCQNLPQQLHDAAIKGLRSAGLRTVGEIVHEMDVTKPYPCVDTGAMRQSTLCEPIPEGAELSVNAPQAAWMEFGTRPHMPPLGPILLWVTRKFQLQMTSRKKGRKKGSRKIGPKLPPKLGPKAPSQQGPRMSAFHKAQRRSMKHAAAQHQDAENLRKALAIANKVRWKIYHHGTEPRGFFGRAMLRAHMYAPQEVRHELKALERRL